MAHLVRHAEVSEQGLRHSTNDDYFLTASELRLYIVCDGVSGHSGGSVASKLAAETVLQALRQKLAGAPYPSIQEAAVLARDAILKASQVIYERAATDPTLLNMATTLELVWQVGEHLLCAHTGDSRVYLWRRGKLQRLTKDHTYVQEMMDNGSMTEDQAKKSTHAHALVHAVGIRPVARVDLLAPEVQNGDVFMICTDGISGGCSDVQLAAILSRSQADLSLTTQELVREARVGGSTDDATVLLIAIEEGATKTTAVPPPASRAAAAVVSPATPPAPPPPGPPVGRTRPLPQDKLTALDLSPCFGELSFADKTKLLEIAEQKHFAPGEVLAREGEITDQLWVLISGKVRISERGTLVVDRAGPTTLGEAALMEQEPRAATITVLEEAHVLEFQRARVLAFFAPHQQNPAAQLYRAIATIEHRRVRELTHRLAEKS